VSVCEALQAITENGVEIQLHEFLITALAGGQNSAELTGPLPSFINLWHLLSEDCGGFNTSSECCGEKRNIWALHGT